MRYGPRARESRGTIRPPGVRRGYPHPRVRCAPAALAAGAGRGPAASYFRRWLGAGPRAETVEK